jgi:hypothetical protein
MRIYADFNGIEKCEFDSDLLCLNLTGYGTLASLSFNEVKLFKGQVLELSDPDGTSVFGTVYFDKNKISKNCSGWFAKFREDEISEGEPLKYDKNAHLCFKCRKNIKPHLDMVGRQYKENCPYCGTPIMFPLLPALSNDA